MLSCFDVRRELQQSSITRIQEMRQPPKMWLYDKDWNEATRKPLFGVIDASFEERLNETGEGSLSLLSSHKLRDYLIEDLELFEDLHIRVEMGGKRWTGKATYVGEKSTNGKETILLNFLDEFEHIKKIVCYCNPLLPAELQYPKLFAFAGPSIFGIKTLLFLNLMRRFALPWTLSDNIFNPSTWLSNLNPANWPIVVKPANFLTDTSMWSVISTRFGNAYDVCAPTLSDAQCQIIPRRWFIGDAQPAPSHYILTQSTLVIDVVDKSGYRGPTGTVLDGLTHFITNVADDLLNEIATAVAVPNPEEYSLSGFLGTKPEKPWVAWRNAHRTGLSGIGDWQAGVHKALAGSIVTGGHSPDWVNAGLKLLANAVLGYIGMMFGNPGLALGIFDSQLEDVVLAFHRVPNPFWQAKMGRAAYGEFWESSGGTGFSLSALQAIRTGFDRCKAYRSYKVETINGAPYWVGRHFDTGDRVAAEIGKKGHYYIDHVYALKYSFSRTQDPKWAIGIGDDGGDDGPGAMLARQIAQVRSIAQAIGVSS